MAKNTLGKGDLQKERLQLKLYLKLLPSLDLKRVQLMAEHSRAKTEMLQLKEEAERVVADAVENLPMLANKDVKLSGLVKLRSLSIVEESIVGVKVPLLKEIAFTVSEYSMLATPAWMEAYIAHLKRAVEAKIRIEVTAARVEKLGRAVARITQHVNLFEKILIPNAKKNIQKIQILIGEAERSAVIRSKLAKSLHQRQETMEAPS